ncbi:predicted protein [Naegleria gruberi]|uniref:Predicted protein n=1 Tax=Naegleria gruberi TaxID=5762 RepID=D2VDC1_NAEGR|nr:uncharacterized protein NAEGRDRAFT_48577 [Naegleria gruberi]EFC45118.1 predicted protein [Naegleria gruberi]|eukprot:XP_002677862.1 predicted protein [Naegleria gruberi strain NEG-M]
MSSSSESSSNIPPTNQQKIEIIRKSIELFQHDKILDAYDLLKKQYSITENSISSLLESRESSSDIDEQEEQNETLSKEEAELVKLIYKDGALAKMLLSEFSSSAGWNTCVDKDDCKTFYKQTCKIDGGKGGSEAEPSLHAIKIEGIIETPVFNLMSILYEVDLYKNWVPQLGECGVIKYLGGNGTSRFRFLSYFSFNLPWPMSSRDSLTYAFVVDRSDYEQDPSILVVIRGADTHKDSSLADLISKHDNQTHVRVGIEYAGFLIKMLSEDTCHVSLIANVDPKLSYIPIWFQNWLTNNLSYLMISKLRQAAEKVPNSEYSVRIKNNDQVYGEITRRLSKFLVTHNLKK